MDIRSIVFAFAGLLALLHPTGAHAARVEPCPEVVMNLLPPWQVMVEPVIRDRETLSSFYTDPKDAATRLDAWGFCGNALATYLIPDLGLVRVSVSVFPGDASGATLALPWLAEEYASGLGLKAIMLPDGAMGPPSNRYAVIGAEQYTIFTRTSTQVWRATFPSVNDERAIAFAEFYQSVVEAVTTAYQRS